MNQEKGKTLQMIRFELIGRWSCGVRQADPGESALRCHPEREREPALSEAERSRMWTSPNFFYLLPTQGILIAIVGSLALLGMTSLYGVLFLFALLPAAQAASFGTEVFVSIATQELGVVKNGKTISRYPISTSKFGIGDDPGSYRTPLGTFLVSAKVGDNLPPGAVIKNRQTTREVVGANAPGRDAIVSRVIWLRGKEAGNRNAHERCIYIHGTPEERRIGKRASFGCVRMRSKDIIALYHSLHIGMHVTISSRPLSDFLPPEEPSLLARAD